MHVLLSVIAAGYGVAAALLLPRPLYRLAVPHGEPWRTECPAGHRLPAGWLGVGYCAPCASPAAASPHATASPPSDSANAAAPPDALPPVAATAASSYGPAPAPLAALSAVVCVLLTLTVGPRPELTVWLLLVPVLLLLAMVDLRARRLPDLLTLPAAVATAALLGLAALLPGSVGSWHTALLSGLALGGGYFVLFLIHPRGMGLGDVKLALTLGLVLGWYGWTVLFVGAFAGFLLGACYGTALILAGRAHRKTALPFGPFMMLGALAGVVLGALAA